MLQRPLSSSPSAFFDGAISSPGERESGVTRSRRPSTLSDGVIAAEVMGRLATDRADAASSALLGAALLMVASAAVALASVGGEAGLVVVAGALCATAVGLVTVVRLRLQRELAMVGEAHGLEPAQARAEARRLASGALRLE